MFTHAIKSLRDGKKAQIKPRGNSMRGRVSSGDIVQLEPCSEDSLFVGDIVLVKVKGNIYLHLIKSIKQEKNKTKYQIGNNVGGINGWVSFSAIFGKATKIESPVEHRNAKKDEGE